MVSEEQFANNTFAMAFERTGQRKQLLKTCEECGELIQAIMKYLQSTDSHGYSMQILEEMGHVDLCLDMIKYDLARVDVPAACGPFNHRLIDNYSVLKRDRLRKWHEFEALEELKRK